MNTQPVLVWMNCYGPWDPILRHPIETIGYNQYLDAFIQALGPIKERVTNIFISGGMVDEKGRTECATVKPELTQRLRKAGLTISVHSDEKSLTSITIARTFIEMWNQRFHDHVPLLFCDEVRFQVNCYAVSYFCRQLNIDPAKLGNVVVPLPRLDIHPHSAPEFQQKKLEVMKERGVEEVERMGIERRKAL